jgi:hypothetical protein
VSVSEVVIELRGMRNFRSVYFRASGIWAEPCILPFSETQASGPFLGCRPRAGGSSPRWTGQGDAGGPERTPMLSRYHSTRETIPIGRLGSASLAPLPRQIGSIPPFHYNEEQHPISNESVFQQPLVRRPRAGIAGPCSCLTRMREVRIPPPAEIQLPGKPSLGSPRLKSRQLLTPKLMVSFTHRQGVCVPRGGHDSGRPDD